MAAKIFSAVGVVFDGDDTLWQTEELYDRAREQAKAIVRINGLPADSWELLQRKRDVENVSRFGFSDQRFPTSCVEAYEELCNRLGRNIGSEVGTRIRIAAQQVFLAKARLKDGAQDVLSQLSTRGAYLALLTKGDYGIQNRRIAESGLAGFFDLIHIVPEKAPQNFLDIAAHFQLPPEAVWSVGNSWRSDVAPSKAAGLRTVWINAHVWEHELSSPTALEGIFELQSLRELVTLIQQTLSKRDHMAA